jgi:hypothetical protein
MLLSTWQRHVPPPRILVTFPLWGNLPNHQAKHHPQHVMIKIIHVASANCHDRWWVSPTHHLLHSSPYLFLSQGGKGPRWPNEWSFSHNRKKAIQPALPCCCFLFSCVVAALLSKGSARKDTDPFSHCWVRRKQRLGRFWGTMMAVRAWLLDVLNPLQEMQCWFWSDETVGCLTPPWFYSPLGETNNGAPPLAVHVAVAYLKSCHVCQLSSHDNNLDSAFIRWRSVR